MRTLHLLTWLPHHHHISFKQVSHHHIFSRLIVWEHCGCANLIMAVAVELRRYNSPPDFDDDDDGGDGVHLNSHKHFIPYMGFCASIWDSVRHHCHHHHHHHDHLKWTVKQQRRRPKNLWANFKRLGWMDISILRHGPALDGRQTWQTTARKPTMASSTGR